MEHDKKAVFLILVTDRRQKEDILFSLKESNINLINVVYGKGAVKEGFLKNILGLVVEENKVVMVCITTCAKADIVLRMLIEKFDFDKPNTGIAFTIPVETVIY